MRNGSQDSCRKIWHASCTLSTTVISQGEIMSPNTEHASATLDPLPILQVEQGLIGSKDGKGIGHLVDAETIDGWVRAYLSAHDGGAVLETAFRYGVGAEGRYAGQSFVEAEPVLRSEWSSERDRQPWDIVRDAVWAGFDRARDRRV
jgi:hypothetical protein